MKRKLIYLCIVLSAFCVLNTQMSNAPLPTTDAAKPNFTDVGDNYAWAKEAITALTDAGVIDGVDATHFAPGESVTKEQYAKMVADALKISPIEGDTGYKDVSADHWSASYVNAVKTYFVDDSYGTSNFYPAERYTREKCAYAVAGALGLTSKKLLRKNVLSAYFYDSSSVGKNVTDLVAVAAESGIVRGSDGYLRPQGEVTRAEAAVILHRAMQYKNKNAMDLFITRTSIVGESKVTVEQAKHWAEKNNAHQRFIDIADTYWKYGEITGMRPEILYAQAAKETGFGKYTGQVKPEQNNWAGIKIKNPVADRPEDHESFATPDDGVRAHFNHLSIYVGLAPVGEVHPRYNVTKTVAWAGTIRYMEQLGGKWAPDVTYGYSIVTSLLEPMEKTQ